MFLLEEAGPLEPDQGGFQCEASQAFLDFFTKQKSSGGASCGAGMKCRWLELLGMEALGKGL